jgi:cytochrome c553
VKIFRLSEPIVVISWLAALIVPVAWVASPSGGQLIAQDARSPSVTAGQSPPQATPAVAPTASDVPLKIDPNVQVLIQGAVHEAFGQPVLFNPGPSPVVLKQAPNPVDELPPSLKPVGDNVRWIPGYWSWEAVQQKFVWTSGIWRVIPPGLAWTPGYWMQSASGYQFVSGFWRHLGGKSELASPDKRLEASGSGNPVAGNPLDAANSAPAAVPDPTAKSAAPDGSSKAANPTSAGGANPAPAGSDNRDAFFKSRIQTVLIGTCAKCHGSENSQNNLRLDGRAALLKGGDSGPAVVPGDPDKSLLIQAVRYTGDVKMPPNKQLPASVIADFERWIRDGAVWPDDVTPSGAVAAATSAPPGTAPVSADVPVSAAIVVPPGGSSKVAIPAGAGGANLTQADRDNRDAFFKSRIQTVLIGTCAKCHGSDKSQNNLRLDSRAALLKGGDSGPAVVPGDPDKSPLIQAVRYTGDIKMPPNKQLPASVIADFERWIRDGAVWPDDVTPSGGNVQQAALQPVEKADSPAASSGTPVTAATSLPPGNAPVPAVPVAPTPSVPTPADPAATASTPPVVDPAATAPPTAAVAPPGTKVASAILYLPQPPLSLESGAVGDPPTADYCWIPGTWIYRHGRYSWFAGQWAPVHRGWTWVPARYVWTPRGHVFVDGYWDYELSRRGVLFAPVTFRHIFPVWGFVHRPSIVLDPERLTEFLFVNGPQGCYYFGDYFEASSIHAGIFPGFAFHMSILGYDPFFAFSSWAHRGDAGWHERLVVDYRARRDDPRLRPPRTFDDLVAQHRNFGEETRPFALPFDKFAARGGPSSLRFESVSRAERDEIERSLRRFQDESSRRSEFETRFSRRAPNRENTLDSRPPVSRAVLGEQVLQEHPAQRLANPTFVPQASNCGRSKPAEQGSTSRSH